MTKKNKRGNRWQADVLARRLEQLAVTDGDDDVLVIGIDFGTTFSGAAWATTADLMSDQINLITSWPGTGREEGKAPTELFYEDGETMWGYEVPHDTDPVRWFKLLLLDDEDIDGELRSSEFLIRGRRMLRENKKSAEDLVADYLRLLWVHVTESIVKARGASVIDAMTFHIVLTVPAIWKDYARNRIRNAAKVAGILSSRAAGPTTLSFAPEPEVAALSTLCEPGRQTEKGDIYVVCDAGGGTVDLISYQIEQNAPIAMREVVEGTGGLCGGIFIDEAFESLCKERLGRKWDRLSKAGVNEVMKGDWECGVKPQFKSGNVGKEYIVSVPAEAFVRSSLDDTTRMPFIKSGRIHFSSENIAGTFSQSFRGIDALVDGQIARVTQNGQKVTGIILVGGLGGSPYLYDHLKQRFTSSGITILQSGGMRPRTAICRGAVIKGFLDGSSAQGDALPISVTSTISRSNIGMVVSQVFNSGIHAESDKYWDSEEGHYRANNQMDWYVKKGEHVPTGTPIRKEIYRICAKNDHSPISVRLFQCEDDVAPLTYQARMGKLCHITVDWDDDLGYEPRTHAATGVPLKKIDYEIVVKPSGASSEFSVWKSGKQLGSSKLNIQYQ
ncbi:actin-like ATPase domain containing protein [Rhypophila sp. PSN 637]